MARRENNFWQFAEWQCELGLQELLTRITKALDVRKHGLLAAISVTKPGVKSVHELSAVNGHSPRLK
jgi:hypothetical protein